MTGPMATCSTGISSLTGVNGIPATTLAPSDRESTRFKAPQPLWARQRLYNMEGCGVGSVGCTARMGRRGGGRNPADPGGIQAEYKRNTSGTQANTTLLTRYPQAGSESSGGWQSRGQRGGAQHRIAGTDFPDEPETLPLASTPPLCSPNPMRSEEPSQPFVSKDSIECRAKRAILQAAI
jgi:hypothetical protein